MNVDLQQYLNQFLSEFSPARLILKLKFIPN